MWPSNLGSNWNLKVPLSQNPLYGHPIITHSLLCPRGKKVLAFSSNSTRLIPLIRTLSRAPSVSVLTGFDCIRCFIYLFNYLSFIPSFIFSLVEEEELREPYQINIKAKNEPAPGSTSSLRHPSPIRPHPTMPRCQHLIF